MSYARWSHSNWYAFDNCNGLFSLWHVKGPHLDHDYDEMKGLGENGFLDHWIATQYPEASEDDIWEAFELIQMAMEERK